MSSFLTNNFSNLLINSDLSIFSINENAAVLFKKLISYGVLNAAVASSAFYVGYYYAKRRIRFDPRVREESKSEQVY
jgi:hypothetical protein